MSRSLPHFDRFIYLGVCLFLSIHIFTQPEPLWFKKISIDEGLASTYVTCIIQDRKGFMWFGTWKGLCRWDGYQFKTYRHDPTDPLSLGDGAVISLLEDQNGALWVGTIKGLDRFDRRSETFTHYLDDASDPSNPSGNRVSDLAADQHGRIWAGRFHGLLCLDVKSGKVDAYVHQPDDPNSLADNRIIALHLDKSGALWIGTMNGLNRLDPRTGQFRRFVKNPEDPVTAATISHNRIMSIQEDSNGLLYFGTKGGLDVFNPNNPKTPFTHFPVLAQAILQDKRDGSWWIGTDEGLYHQARRHLESMDWNIYFANPGVPDGLSSSSIRWLHQDDEGTIWIATNNGINLLTPEAFQFRHYQKDPENPNSLSDDLLYSVIESRDKTVWLGTNGAGLNSLDPETGVVRRYPFDKPGTPYSTNSNHVFRVYEDRSGGLWVGLMDAGLDRLDRNTETFTHFKWNDIRDFVTFFYEDKNNTLWIGHQAGVSRFDPATKTFEFAHYAPEMAGKSGLGVVTGILQDHIGAYWVSSNIYYLNRFDPETLTYRRILPDPQKPESVSSDNIQAIYEDQKGRLWVGTNKGLDLYDRDKGTFRHFGLEDGLPDLMMGHMLEDSRGFLWIATGKGITRFDPATAQFRNYDKEDGLSSNESWDFAKSPTSGAFLLATANGLTIFNPDSLAENRLPPKVVFTKFKRFNTKAGGEIEEKGISEKEVLHLTYLDDILTFEFSALSFRKPSKNQYAYKLEGFHDEWIPLGIKRDITFTNLNSGAYVLRVKASNGDGVWNEQGASLRIYIAPPWWAAWWAYLLYAVLFAGLIVTLYRFQLNRKLALAEADRMKELDSFKSRFYTNITHEFRTPLTVISGMVDQIRENPAKWLSEGLEMIRRNAAGLLRLVNQMLDLSKLESGSLPLRLIHGDLIGYLNYLLESYRSYAESKRIGLYFETGLEHCLIDYDPEILEQIVSNLASNAIRFTPEGGKVTISANFLSSEKGGGHLEIRVQDTGIGIPPDQLPYIFDRFYQVSQPSGKEPGPDFPITEITGGSGIGLALTRELVKLLGGQIKAESLPGQGSVFTVLLPVQRRVDFGFAQSIGTQAKGGGKPEKQTGQRDHPHKKTTVGGKNAVEHLLIVEDNTDVVRYLTACLEDRYRLRIASDGAEGLEAARSHIPDLIISDVMMPRIDGFEFCSALKKDERSSHIPVILLTAKGDLASRLEGLQSGADAYLVKPFNKGELMVQIQNLLDNRQALQAHYLALATAPNPAATGAAPEENAFVLKVRAIVETHLADSNFDVEQLCRATGMSNSNLHRKLTALTGHSANRFIRHIRLNKACSLLRNPEPTIAAVADDCGFNDPVYFARAFRQEFGVSPSEWRATHIS